MKSLNLTGLILLSFFSASCKEKPSLPQLSTNKVVDIFYTTAKTGGNIINDGGALVLSRGVCWSTSPEPDINDRKTIESGTTGSFTSQLQQLNPGTTYYTRAYATNSEGTAYGNQVSFQTLPIEPPELSTTAITDISRRTVVSGGIVTEENGSAVYVKGVCWSKSKNPTTNDSKTTDGSGTGPFTSHVTGLKGGITYYLRAYASNSAGTSYGNEISFTTALPELPCITTKTVTSILTTTITCGATITSDGEGEISQQGLCWSTSPYPVVSNNIYSDPSLAPDFTHSIAGLSRNSIYYIRAYATNAAGTAYGDEFAFRTFAAIDADNNKYYSVTIGTQEWMQSNLRTTRYANGDPIPTTDNPDIVGESSPKYQWPCEGDESKVQQYGRFYTWFTVSDARKICPAEWHVGTDDDWSNLENYLILNGYNYDGTLDGNRIGKALASLAGWIYDSWPPAIGSTAYPEYRNKSGFSAYPSGYRITEGIYNEFGRLSFWWTSTEKDIETVWVRDMIYNGSTLNRIEILKYEQALTVRCIKD